MTNSLKETKHSECLLNTFYSHLESTCCSAALQPRFVVRLRSRGSPARAASLAVLRRGDGPPVCPAARGGCPALLALGHLLCFAGGNWGAWPSSVTALVPVGVGEGDKRGWKGAGDSGLGRGARRRLAEVGSPSRRSALPFPGLSQWVLPACVTGICWREDLCQRSQFPSDNASGRAAAPCVWSAAAAVCWKPRCVATVGCGKMFLMRITGCFSAWKINSWIKLSWFLW